ncbi:hypothetical protein Pla175_09190 [Pirellulimonas nuda]|uniref:Lipoprotein n=1 Tax=Pirellulimonas nuda TaxID=2528009 RepID=A0A518D7V3_9BACT|nr:DUF6786 family protein [Pirellulimonas nuda]QDU87554.1 hypothetical protein Pla175_09190 [Pirellulimonas nuda]
MKRLHPHLLVLTLMTITGAGATGHAATFGDDAAFLRPHTEVVVLKDASGQSQLIVAPAWQGRVMTSTARGAQGDSFGWINRELIASGKVEPHINVFGGEDRFWLGPEGGQFSIFFAEGAPFDLEHWFTPPSLDTEPFEVESKSDEHVTLSRRIDLVNYSGAQFNIDVKREVRLLDAGDALKELGTELPPKVDAVAFESINSIANAGQNAWKKDSGLLSIWVLGMFRASPESAVVIPYQKGSVAERGVVVNDDYFGKVPADRLVVEDDVLFFRADAQKRSKIGLTPSRARPVLGSYDSATHTLTLVQFTLPPDASDYVNSMWELQDEPFSGDAVNSYNDDGNLGSFYELESSSPALALRPGASATHRHRTIHLQGSEEALDPIAQAMLGVGLEAIRNAFAQ